MHRSIRTLSKSVAVLLAVSIVQGTPAANAEQPGDGLPRVISRERLGGYIEETAVITHGRFANHIAVSNGYEVIGIPLNANSDPAAKTLFDSFDVPYDVPPKGMAFIESEGTMAYVEGGTPESLFISDMRGRPLETRPIAYTPVPLDFLHNEGLAYVPATAPVYPDHLLMLANRFPDTPPFIAATIEVIRRDGTVVEQIHLDSPLGEDYVTGITIKGPNELLIGLYNQIWTVDFSGHIVAGPVFTPGPFVEGLERLPDGRFVMTAAASLYYFDSELNRLPQDDRHLGIGTGLLATLGYAWDSTRGEHIVNANTETSGDYFVAAMAASLSPGVDEMLHAISFDPAESWRVRDVEHLSNEDVTAVLLIRVPQSPAQIVIYEPDGDELERISLASLGGSPDHFTYIEQTDEFAVVLRGAAQDHKLRIVSRDGVLRRTLDLSPQGVIAIVSVASFNPGHPSGGQFLAIGNPITDGRRAYVLDFDGNVGRQFPYREALRARHIGDVDAITSGPNAGAFGAVDLLNHEVIVFRID